MVLNLLLQIRNKNILNGFSNISERSDYFNITFDVSTLPLPITCNTVPEYQLDNFVNVSTDTLHKDITNQPECVKTSPKLAKIPN